MSGIHVREDVIDRASIAAMHRTIAPHVRRTPVIETAGRDVGVAAPSLAFKLESMQPSGSFKVRGAFANLLTRQVPPAGIAAASGGNHGAAVAYAAMRLGVKARIFVPEVSARPKVERIRSYGAELVVTGQRYADAAAACAEYVAATGALSVHAFDQEETLLGTGTIGLEIEEQLRAVDTVLVAVGGGGLIGGVASWFAASGIRIVGVEPEAAPTLARALAQGRPVDAPAGGIAADSLAPARMGELGFHVARRFVDRVLLVSDDELRAAQRVLWEGLNAIAEPGGAAAFAALLSGRYAIAPGERVCVVVSGGNSAGVSFA